MKETLSLSEFIEFREHFFEISRHMLAISLLLDLDMPEARAEHKAYPFMTKAELAVAFGASPRSFRRMLHMHQADLMRMGISKTAKMLTPEAVKFLCEALEIPISALQKNK